MRERTTPQLYRHTLLCFRLQEEAELSRIDQRDAIAYKDTKMKFVESHKQDVVGKVSCGA